MKLSLVLLFLLGACRDGQDTARERDPNAVCVLLAERRHAGPDTYLCVIHGVNYACDDENCIKFEGPAHE